MDAYPVIADDMDLLYIEEDYRQVVAADQNARYRLVLKDEEMDCKALQHCMDMGAIQSQILELVDSKGPMAVWEKEGQYAIRTVGEVNMERASAKESDTVINR